MQETEAADRVYVTTSEASRLTGLPYRTLVNRDWRRAQRLFAHKVGKRLLFKRDELFAFIEKCRESDNGTDSGATTRGPSEPC